MSRGTILIAVEKPDDYDSGIPVEVARGALMVAARSAIADFGGQTINAVTGGRAADRVIEAVLADDVRWALLRIVAAETSFEGEATT